MSANPNFQHIFGKGKPRLIVWAAALTYESSTNTTYTSSTVIETGSPTFFGVRVGMLITSFKVISGQPNKPVYAKVRIVDVMGEMITVDEWIGGTPTDGQTFRVGGFVVDLPFCSEKKLRETFTPDQLIHQLFRSRLASKFYGWKYAARLDYSAHLYDDVLIDMAPALNILPDDKLVLIPRVDKPQNQYNVLFDQAIDISRYGISPGYEGVVLTFRGKENTSWPIPTTGYGFGYAENYGYQL